MLYNKPRRRIPILSPSETAADEELRRQSFRRIPILGPGETMPGEAEDTRTPDYVKEAQRRALGKLTGRGGKRGL
jgi:hypothetical protein